MERANAKEKVQDFIEAIEDYTSAINISPESAFVYKKRSAVRKRIGDLVGAKNDNQIAQELSGK